MNSVQKNPGVSFKRGPDEAKYYEASAYPSELAGPGSVVVYIGANIFNSTMNYYS